jgi:Transcription factor TFIID (or TATA-binding protein, TBP)
MKHQQKSNDEIDTNQLLIDSSSEELDEAMMADSSFDATGTKILMPHELVASGSANVSSLVGQHSIHSTFNDLHGTSFYHTPSAATTTLGTGYNGFHNSTFQHYSPNNLNGTSTIMTTNSSSFNTLIHQQPITLSNHHQQQQHQVTTTMPPPLIPYHQTTTHQSSFYTTAAQTTASSNINQKEKSAESAVSINAMKVEEHREENETTEEDEGTVAGAVPAATEDVEEPEIDIVISNVVCAFSVRCHLALKEIALHGANVEYKRENGMVTMKLRKPYTTASIWSSGMKFFLNTVMQGKLIY